MDYVDTSKFAEIIRLINSLCVFVKKAQRMPTV